jgi:hypothetical protein
MNKTKYKQTSSEKKKNLIKKIHKQGWWSGLSSKSTCLTSVRPQVQTPVLPQKKKKKRKYINKEVVKNQT